MEDVIPKNASQIENASQKCRKLKMDSLKAKLSSFGGLGVSVLASGTQVRGFKPGRSRRNFKGGKILSTPSFGREVKPWVPCRRFAACKRTLNVPWKSAFRLNSRSYPRP
jgi:hypothetical protein